MSTKLFQQIDNAPLILFRIFFGFLFACETFGAIFTGWIKSNFILPEFTFSHIGMEWLQPLPGYGMYCYFGVMGCLSLMVMIGYKYRYNIALLTLLWAGAYYMQKTAYNNHYYLLMLVGLIMCFLPANAYASVDARQNPELKKLTMPAWCSLVMILQISIVYFFATIAKFYPDWLDGTFTKSLFSEIRTTPYIHYIFSQDWFSLLIAYSGIAFDGLIIPMLLWKRTRTLAVVASLLFHLFNSIFLKIGIFPYFALSFAAFFYSPEIIRKRFFKHKPIVSQEPVGVSNRKSLFYWFFVPYMILQLLLPLRHWVIKGDVLWTEEGHRLSWRMMLRERTGVVTFRVVDKKNNRELPYSVSDHLTRKQLEGMSSRPDMIWQMAQRIKSQYLSEGKEVGVYVTSLVSVNQKPFRPLIDSKVDLASVKWDYFCHSKWVLLYD